MPYRRIHTDCTKRFASPEDEAPGIDIAFSIRVHSLHRLLPVLKYAATALISACLTARMLT